MKRLAFSAKLRMDFYRTLRKQCEGLSHSHDPEIQAYKQDYEKEIRRRWQPSSLTQMVESLMKSHVVLLGDFHALNQSQKGHLRILRLLPRQKKCILFVEFIKSQNQADLDNYLSGKISEKEFLKLTRWEESWGFPWRSYKPILHWAKQRKVPVVAIDKALKFHGDQSLKIRDQFAAELVVEHLQKNPESIGIVIIGDYHISRNHLPSELKKLWPSVQITRVFQNSETIYFKLLEKKKELDTDVIRFSAFDFGVVSVAPWVKWHALLTHLQSKDEDWEEGDKAFEDVLKFYRIIQVDLGVVTDEDFEVVTLSEDDFFSQIEAEESSRSRRLVELLFRSGSAFYFADRKKVLVPNPDLNHLAESAALVWLGKVGQQPEFYPLDPKWFYHTVWMYTVGYFGAKLINPKRKTDTINDLKNIWYQKKAQDPSVRWVIELYLKGETMSLGVTKKPLNPRKIPLAFRLKVSRTLGQILGERLYYAFFKRLISAHGLIELLMKPFDLWEENYFTLMDMIQHWPEPYASKLQKV